MSPFLFLALFELGLLAVFAAVTFALLRPR